MGAGQDSPGTGNLAAGGGIEGAPRAGAQGVTYFEEAAVERSGHRGAVDNQVLARVVHVADELQHSDAAGRGHGHAVVLRPGQRLQAAHCILQLHGRLPPRYQEAERCTGPGGRVRRWLLPARLAAPLALLLVGRHRPLGRGPHPGLVGRAHFPSSAEAGFRGAPIPRRRPAAASCAAAAATGPQRPPRRLSPLRPGAPPSQEGPRRC